MIEKEPVQNGASGDLAVIGEGTQNRQQVSLQVLQGIYHELTGKSEELSKSFEEPIQLTAAEFEQFTIELFRHASNIMFKQRTYISRYITLTTPKILLPRLIDFEALTPGLRPLLKVFCSPTTFS